MNAYKECKNVVRDEWLSSLLKKEAYKITLDESFSGSDAMGVIKDLQAGNVFLYSKVPVTSLQMVKFLEGLGFYLVDTNVMMQKSVFSHHDLTMDMTLRFASGNDKHAVGELARKGFAFSRFHFDDQITAETANLIKCEWASNYFSGKRGKYMIVAVIDDRIRGFLQLLENEQETLIIDLVAVDKDFRSKGIASGMIAFAEKKCENISKVVLGTQIANVPALRAYQKMGFKITGANYMFHYHSKKAE